MNANGVLFIKCLSLPSVRFYCVDTKLPLSPLQFQKKLRLLEAQRLMLTERIDAISASYEVGYESHTQFNREYKRMFGNSPAKDIKNILSPTNGKIQ